MMQYLHLQYSCRISHLPAISYSQGIVRNLKIKLLKVDLDHLWKKYNKLK